MQADLRRVHGGLVFFGRLSVAHPTVRPADRAAQRFVEDFNDTDHRTNLVSGFAST